MTSALTDHAGSSEDQGAVKVVITGGGTAGHTNPGIAVAQALVAKGLSADSVRFIGGERGNEGTIVPQAGFTIDLLPGRGIQRSLAPRAVQANFGAIVGLVSGLGQAFRLMRRLRPEVVLCLGGYASSGASLAALALRIPVVVTEQNARASAVNRMIGRFAKVCALPYPDTDLPKGVLTGNPIRAEVIEAVEGTSKAKAREILDLPSDRFVVAVWAGSLGARRINEQVRALAELWSDRSDVAIHHVVGRRDWDQFSDVTAFGDTALHYQVVEYEVRMPILLAAADLAICRSGASTTAELAVAGLPSLAIPLPHAPRDHQRANIAELEKAGAAVVLEDASLTADLLATLIDEVILDETLRQTRSDAAKSVGRPDAAEAVATIVCEQGNIVLPSTPEDT